MQLADRRVVVTGASRGIGKVIAESCAAAGARLALVARSEGPLKDLAAKHRGATAHPVDLADPEAVTGLIERIEADGGPVDVLINNAGAANFGPLHMQDASEVEQMFRINLLTPVHLCRQVLPGMLARGRGHIVNVSSLAGVAAFPGMVAYASTKAGLSHFTSGLRADLKGTPIGVTLVELGFVPTDMYDHVGSYRPTELAKQRLDTLGILADVPLAQVGEAVVGGVVAGRRHVRLPKRAAVNAIITETPRRVVELLLTGVPHRDQRDQRDERG
jgi:short-subunit dehydrogenase